MSTLSPLATALECSESITSETAKSTILETVAKTQFRADRLEDALHTAEKSPRKSYVLRQLAIDASTQDDSGALVSILKRLVDAEPEASPLAGRLAQSFLDRKDVDGALKVVRSVKEPFEGDRAKYDFIFRLYENDLFDDAEPYVKTFKDSNYTDWSNLALLQRFARIGRKEDAARIVELFPSPEKKAWGLVELVRIVADNALFLRRAAAIHETISVDKTNAESISIQRRIVGKTLFDADETELARELLESSEAAVMKIPDLFRRFRAQCFLAKTLQETGELDSVRNYINVAEIVRLPFSTIERSEILQWFAEASRNDADWTLAVAEAAKEKDELKRSRRIVEILNRFSYKDSQLKPTGEPDRDAVLLSGESFENHYYSPFTLDDCGC